MSHHDAARPACAEVGALAEAAGEGGAGSIAILPETAVRGLEQADRDRLIELGKRSGLPCPRTCWRSG